jgi:glycosyltransferase involved in cell wall biosynthesis
MMGLVAGASHERFPLAIKTAAKRHALPRGIIAEHALTRDSVVTVMQPDSGATMSSTTNAPSVSVIIPCLNEEENIRRCVRAAIDALERNHLDGEVIVVDNDSDDLSAKLAAEAGATVIHEQRRRYGSAYLADLAQARGEFVVMADADLTYDFDDIPRFVERLQAGAELVMDDRMDNIEPGAMPWLHRYIGNPILTGVLNVLFRTGVRNAHCGMRAIPREALPRLDLRTTGMEFASEMVVRAAKEGLVIEEVAIRYAPRGGTSKLSSLRDGQRHLRFLLLHGPLYLFIVPGAAMCVFGLLASVMVLANVQVFGRLWDLHTLIARMLLLIVGVQVMALGVCAQAYSTDFMGERDRWLDTLRHRFRVEHGLLIGAVVGLAGFVLGAIVVIGWIADGFPALADERLALVAATLVIIGVQMFFASFLLSILGLRRVDR